MPEKRLAPMPTVYRKVAEKITAEVVGKSFKSLPLIIGGVSPVFLLFLGSRALGEVREDGDDWIARAPDGATSVTASLRAAVIFLVRYQAADIADALVKET
jgi:hypothetical protein